eukprot:scaffold34881_cov19-Tisochrysis_lutea.AAC.2
MRLNLESSVNKPLRCILECLKTSCCCLLPIVATQKVVRGGCCCLHGVAVGTDCGRLMRGSLMSLMRTSTCRLYGSDLLHSSSLCWMIGDAAGCLPAGSNA